MPEIILPIPREPFRWRSTQWGPALVCDAVEPLAPHLFSTRQWLVGDGSRTHLLENDNKELDTHIEDLKDIDEPRPVPQLAQALGVDRGMLKCARQVHGRATLVADDDREPAITDADILLTRTLGRAVSVRAADCAPLLLVDRATGAVAAAHAGWRGMAVGVARAAVEALIREYGSRPRDLVAAVGPSIGACCYQVGADVLRAFGDSGFATARIERWFLNRPAPTPRNSSLSTVPRERRPDRWFFDGWTAMRDQLEDAGLDPEQIFVAELCTASHPAVFCSYRREGHTAGRLIAAITPRPLRPSPR